MHGINLYVNISPVFGFALCERLLISDHKEFSLISTISKPNFLIVVDCTNPLLSNICVPCSVWSRLSAVSFMTSAGGRNSGGRRLNLALQLGAEV